MIRFTLIALALAGTAAAQKAQPGRFTIDAFDLDTEATLTIRAEEAPAVELVQGIADKLDLVVVGSEQISGDRLVDVYLVRRPARDAIRWVLGSTGLRARITSTEIRLEEDVPAIPTHEELLVNAVLGFERALRLEPDHGDAARLEMWLGDAQEQLGPAFYAQAVAAFVRIADEHPSSDLVPDALLRAGRLLSAQGRWADAALRFSQLADLEITKHEHRPTALLELGRALCHVGEGIEDPVGMREQARKALATLDALDHAHPTRDHGVRHERLLVRALAETLGNEPMHAMRTLDLAQSYSPYGDRDPQIAALRPMAFSRAGRHGDASTAWLRHADALEGPERIAALRAAAEEALAGDHELAVLFIHKMAVNEGAGEQLDDLRNEAEIRLQLGGERVTQLGLAQEIARAASMLERRDHRNAVTTLRAVWVRRDELSGEDRLRTTLMYARALEGHGYDNEPLDVLRTALAETETEAFRRQLYRLAADMHERAGRWNHAIEALKGNL